MKQLFTNSTTKLFLVGIVCVLSITSCKKVELGVPLVKPINSHGKLPPPAVVYNSTLTVTPTGTTTVTVTDNPNTGGYDPSCECYPSVTNTVTPTNPETTPPSSEVSSCPTVSYPIFAGAGGNDTTKGKNVGTVSYSNDGVNLYVQYTFSGPTCPKEIHVWAGSDLSTMPSSSGGVPFGQFPYKDNTGTCGTRTFTIPLASLFPSGTDACNKNVFVVLHAAMSADSNDTDGGGQTAVGYGSQTFGGPRWGWIATYPVCCSN